MKIRVFPNCPMGTSQIRNTLFKTSIIDVKCCGSEGPLEIFILAIFSFAIMYPRPKECN